jgi:hypothetical protein
MIFERGGGKLAKNLLSVRFSWSLEFRVGSEGLEGLEGTKLSKHPKLSKLIFSSLELEL